MWLYPTSFRRIRPIRLASDLFATFREQARPQVQGAPADLQDVTAARAEFEQRAKPWAQWAAVLPAYTQVAGGCALHASGTTVDTTCSTRGTSLYTVNST